MNAESALAETIANTWNFADPRASEQRFLELAERLLATGDRVGSWETWTQVARARGLDRRFEEGHEALDALASHVDGAPPTVRVRVLLERGRLFNSGGAPATARPLFEQAWNLARTVGLDALAVDAAHMVALTHSADPDEAIAWNDTALALARGSAEHRARQWLGSLLNNQGWTYLHRGDRQRALELFREAYDLRVEQDGAGPRGAPTRIAAWAVARALRAAGHVEDALARQTQLEREWEAAGSSNGFVLEEIAECHLVLDGGERAAPHFARAHAVLAKVPRFADNEAARLERLARLGGVAKGT